MRYSEIIGIGFHSILLSPEESLFLDLMFLGAAHSRFRAIENQSSEVGQQHRRDHFRFLREILATVAGGDFREAKDSTGRNLADPRRWSPAWTLLAEQSGKDLRCYDFLLPDEGMFSLMLPDRRFGFGDFRYPVLKLIYNADFAEDVQVELLKDEAA